MNDRAGNENRFAHILRGILATSAGEQKRDVFLVRYLYRPVSFPLSIPPLLAGLTPNQLTLCNFIVLIAACAALGAGSPGATWLGAGLYVFLFVSDCIDGNMARYLNRRRYYGKVIDGLVDVLCFLIFIAIALGNVRSGNNAYPELVELAAGMSVTISLLATSYFRARLMFVLGEIRQSAPAEPVSPRADSPRRPLARAVLDFYQNLGPAGPLIFICALAAGRVSEFILAYGVVFTLLASAEIVYGLYTYRKVLDVPRPTKSSPP